MTLNEQRSFLIGLSCKGLLRGARKPLFANVKILGRETAAAAIRFRASRHLPNGN